MLKKVNFFEIAAKKSVSLEALKYIIKRITPYDRSKFYPHFDYCRSYRSFFLAALSSPRKPLVYRPAVGRSHQPAQPAIDAAPESFASVGHQCDDYFY